MKLFRTKTFWTGVAALISAAAGFFTGQTDLAQSLQMALTGLTAIFLRHGIVREFGPGERNSR